MPVKQDMMSNQFEYSVCLLSGVICVLLPCCSSEHGISLSLAYGVYT